MRYHLKGGELTVACYRLSSQLYATSTHFIQELVQNADDNVYPKDRRPTLCFTYKPGSLRIDCNEVGFTPANVEALCAVSQSTKSGKAHHGEHIGEKGIGFKSVFKAADVVWISSQEFTFKFDKTESPLGMVTPEWAEFPEPTGPDFTSMLLELSERYDQDTLIRDLLTFDANLLIFLRRVKEINVVVEHEGHERWEKKISKKGHSPAERPVVELQDGEDTLRYLIWTHSVKGLPPDEKRPNWSESRLLLAFPVGGPVDLEVELPLQNVYAFLPIRSYGFKVCLGVPVFSPIFGRLF